MVPLVFVIVAVAGFDPADPPSTLVSTVNSPAANPAGPVGASIAWWSYRVIGPGIWVLLARIVGMVTLAPVTITHPSFARSGPCWSPSRSPPSTKWLVLLGVFAGPMVGLSGLLGSELSSTRRPLRRHRLSLILLTALKFPVAADEIVLAFPATLTRWMASRTVWNRPQRHPSCQHCWHVDSSPVAPAAGGDAWGAYEEEQEEEEEDEDGWYEDEADDVPTSRTTPRRKRKRKRRTRTSTNTRTNTRGGGRGTGGRGDARGPSDTGGASREAGETSLP